MPDIASAGQLVGLTLRMNATLQVVVSLWAPQKNYCLLVGVFERNGFLERSSPKSLAPIGQGTSEFFDRNRQVLVLQFGCTSFCLPSFLLKHISTSDFTSLQVRIQLHPPHLEYEMYRDDTLDGQRDLINIFLLTASICFWCFSPYIPPFSTWVFIVLGHEECRRKYLENM